ncbi:MAG: Stp1/IreP family PP2C-type Ser/Thr phosphatase [Bacilli bacterium]|nr:Stp1/IreP family PP2C-type Ser/Thr phosphatase [Bacilli bacterium]
MQTFYMTDAGKVRTHNEDNVIIINNKNNEFILAVADGMGGHKAGEIASNIAIEHIAESFEGLESLGKKEDAIEWIREVVKEINNKIFSYTKDHPESKGMGTTLVVAVKTEDYILYGNIGDSSGYVIKNEKIHKVTKDHTLVNLLVSTGELTPEQAKFHPRKNLLTRALGANDPIEIDIFDVDNTVQGLFLCSDGLTNMVTDEQIEKVLNSNLGVEEQVEKLIKKSNMRGGTDNISIAYLKKESGDL